MNIRIGDYGVRTLDDLQVVLYEIKKVQDEESKNYGKEREVNLGYFGDMGTALKKLYQLMVRRSDAETVEDLLEAFKSSEQAVAKLVEECKKTNRTTT